MGVDNKKVEESLYGYNRNHYVALGAVQKYIINWGGGSNEWYDIFHRTFINRIQNMEKRKQCKFGFDDFFQPWEWGSWAKLLE